MKSGYWLAAQEKTKDLRRVIEASPSVNILKANS